MAEHFWTEKEIEDTVNFQSPKLLLDYLYLLKQTEEQQNCIQSFVSLAGKYFWADSLLA